MTDMAEQVNPERPIAIRKERDFGAIIGVVFEFIRANAKTLLKSLLFILGPIALLVGFGQGMYLQSTLSMFNPVALGAGGALGSMLPGLLVTLFFGGLATAVTFALVPNFVLLYLQRGVGGFDVSDVWEAVKEDFIRVFVTLIVIAVLTFAPAVLIIFMGTASGEVFVIVPLFLLAMPVTLYVAVALSLALPIRVVERLGIGESIRRSFTLISGKWWFTFWLFFVLGIIVGILSFIVQLPIQIMMPAIMLGGSDPSEYMGALVVVGAIAGAVSQLLYSPFAIAATLQYFNLVEMKEGVGMIDRIQEIGGSTADVDPTRL